MNLSIIKLRFWRSTKYTFRTLNKWILSRLPWIHVSLLNGLGLNSPLRKRLGPKQLTTEMACLIIYWKDPLLKHSTYRAKYPDIEVCVQNFVTRYNKNDMKLHYLHKWMRWSGDIFHLFCRSSITEDHILFFLSLYLCPRPILTLSQTSPGFYVTLQYKSLENTWEKEKFLDTSNFSFSLSVFYSFG